MKGEHRINIEVKGIWEDYQDKGKTGRDKIREHINKSIRKLNEMSKPFPGKAVNRD